MLVFETNFPELKLLKRGKVRDIYDLGDSLLLVATDRISAFDVIIPTPIPEKGIILNQISLFWFEQMKDIVGNHIITSNVEEYPKECKKYSDILEGRSVIVKKAEPLPIECIVRGYISGSGWKSYQESGKICGITLPEDLMESEVLRTPIFTPSTKEEVGDHDININFNAAAKIVGEDIINKVERISLLLYTKGAALAAKKGIIIADTKFEFGICEGKLILIDEILTPDSSRFWPQISYLPGGAQDSFDKQYVRDYLEEIKWDKKPPAPKLPEKVVHYTRDKYTRALSLLTGIALGTVR